MNIDTLMRFTSGLRTEVAQLRHRGLSETADVIESIAKDHQEILESWHTEELTLRQAEQESGYSYSYLQQQKALNIGTTGSPRIRRCDLPCKARRSGPQLENGQPDIAGEILTSKLAGE